MKPLLKLIFRFGLIAAALLALFQLTNASFFLPTISTDLMIGLAAVILIGLGIYLGRSTQQPSDLNSTVSRNNVDQEQIAKLGISSRELEVLELIAKGNSNLEIANQLFLSESTVKTHVSNLFVKLDVKRRTQAVIRAKEWGVIAETTPTKV